MLNKTKHPIYTVWRGMKERCTNPNHKNYNLYKGKLCEEWYDSQAFIDWALVNGYEIGLTIDRINSDEGYKPDNCQFITAKQNTIKGNKERRLKEYKYKDKLYTCKELSKLLNINYNRLYQQLTKQKYSIEECIKRNSLRGT